MPLDDRDITEVVMKYVRSKQNLPQYRKVDHSSGVHCYVVFVILNKSENDIRVMD